MILMKTIAVTNDAKISLFQVKPRLKSDSRMVNHCFRNEEIKPGHSAGLRVAFSFHCRPSLFEKKIQIVFRICESAEGSL